MQRLTFAINALRDAGRALVEQFQGTELERLESEIQLIISNTASSQIDSINEVGDTANAMWRSQRAAIDSIRAYLDGQLLGDTSTLTPLERLEEAQRQFDAAVAAANGGDLDALADLPRLADLLLREGVDYLAQGSSQFGDLEASVRAILEGFANLNIGPEPGVGAVGAAGVGGQVTVSAELQALYDERDALLAQLELENRQALAEQLALVVRDLVAGFRELGTGETLAEIAATIGLNLGEMVTALGINLGELTADTALALAGVAQTLGVDLAELAGEIGVELGELSDRQSLLNSALDATLESVPEEIRNRLLGPIDALRDAVTETDISDAMFDLLAITDELPDGIRNLLAPFFDTIDPAPILTELGTLRDLYDLSGMQLAQAEAQTGYLLAIATALSDINAATGVPGYEDGTANVPRTGLALLHSGEMVLPAPVAAFVRREGLTSGAGGSGGDAVVTELRAMHAAAETRAVRAEARAERAETESRTAIERLTAEIRRIRDALTSN
jgi:hypothetical protein